MSTPSTSTPASSSTPSSTPEPDATEKFSKSVSGLLKFMLKVMRENEKNKVSLSNTPNPAIVAITRYRDLFEESSDSGSGGKKLFVDHFGEVYQKNRRDVCRGYLNDHWLRKNDSNAAITVDRRRVSLALVYDICCRIRDATEEQISVGGNFEGNPALVYPEVFLLHLYRIFRECLVLDPRLAESPKEAEMLKKNIEKLEEVLTLRPVENKPDSTQKDLALPTPAAANNVLPIAGLGEMLSGLTSGNGNLDTGALFGMISNLTGGLDPRIKEGVDSLLSEVKGKSITEAMGTIINKVSVESPEIATEVRKTFGNMIPLPPPSSSSSAAPALPAPASSSSAPSSSAPAVEYEP